MCIQKETKVASLEGSSPAISIPTFSGKTCTSLTALDAQPIRTELLVCWKALLAGVWALVSDYNSLSSTVLGFSN